MIELLNWQKKNSVMGVYIMEISIKTSELAKVVGLSGQRVGQILSEQKHQVVKYGNANFVEPMAAREYLESRGFKYRHAILSMFNSKGGVGKSTIAVLVAIAAAQHGAKVLLVDLDQQANSTIALGHEDEDSASMYEIYSEEATIQECIVNVAKNIDLLPSSMNMTFLDRAISQKNENIGSLIKDELSEVEYDYDLIILDLPPALNTVVASSILASDEIIIPTTSGKFAEKGVNVAMDEIKNLSRKFKVDEPQVSIVFNKYDRRKSSCREYLTKLLESYKDYLNTTYLGTSTVMENVQDKDVDFLLKCKKSDEKEDVYILTREILGINDFFVNEEI